MKTTTCAAALGIMLLLAGTAWADRIIAHAMGETKVPDAPEQIVTLTNETTETALAIGIVPVGATSSWYGNPWYPHLGDRMSSVAEVGTELAVNLEAVAVLEPDLIIGSRKRDEEIYDQLSAIAPTVLIDGIGDWEDNFSFVAGALGKDEEGAEALATYTDRVAALRESLGPRKSENLSVVRFVPGQIYLYQAGSFLGHVLADVGFTRPSPQDEDGLAIAVGTESIPDMDGDKLISLTYDTGDGKGHDLADTVLADPLWAQLDVVQSGNAYHVDDGVWATAGGYFAAHAMLDDLARIYNVDLPPAE